MNIASDGMALARISSIPRLTKRAAPLITLSNSQHLTNCAIFGQSRTCNRVRVKVRTRVRVRGLGSGLGYWVSFRVRVRLWLGLGFAQLAKCAARLVKRAH